jgi:hypothetical protein
MVGVSKTFGKLFPKWYAILDARKKKEFSPYVVSMLHHLSMVPIAWYYLYKDYQLADYSNGGVDYSSFIALVVPFCTGFIIADTVCFAIQQAIAGTPEYLFHHILSVWMIFALLSAPGQLTRYYPHLLISDTTNIFFNTAWLLRLFGFRGSTIVVILENLFALSFLLLRAINVALVFFVIFFSVHSEVMGIARYTLPLIAMLQWYWMSKIGATALGFSNKRIGDSEKVVGNSKEVKKQ